MNNDKAVMITLYIIITIVVSSIVVAPLKTDARCTLIQQKDGFYLMKVDGIE